MSDEATVKRRHRRAVQAAIKTLERSGYSVSKFRGPTYDLTADKHKDIRKIKISLDKFSTLDMRNIEQDTENAIYSRELWAYKSIPGKGWFNIKIF